MSLDAVKEVIAAEQASAQQRADSEREAMRLIEAAQTQGAAQLAAARAEAEQQVRSWMQDAERETATLQAVQRSAAAQRRAEILAEGRRHLDQAAAWIVGKVVEF